MFSSLLCYYFFSCHFFHLKHQTDYLNSFSRSHPSTTDNVRFNNTLFDNLITGSSRICIVQVIPARWSHKMAVAVAVAMSIQPWTHPRSRKTQAACCPKCARSGYTASWRHLVYIWGEKQIWVLGLSQAVLVSRNSKISSEVMEVREWVKFGMKMISVAGVCLPSFFHTLFFNYQQLMIMKLNYRWQHPPPPPIFTWTWKGRRIGVRARGGNDHAPSGSTSVQVNVDINLNPITLPIMTKINHLSLCRPSSSPLPSSIFPYSYLHLRLGQSHWSPF